MLYLYCLAVERVLPDIFQPCDIPQLQIQYILEGFRKIVKLRLAQLARFYNKFLHTLKRYIATQFFLLGKLA